MNLDQLLEGFTQANLQSLHDAAWKAARAEENSAMPLPAWIAQILARELCRRMAAPLPKIAPLVLVPCARDHALQWLEDKAQECVGAITDGGPDVLRLALLFDHVARTIRAADSTTLH